MASYLVQNMKMKISRSELNKMTFDLVSYSLKAIFTCSDMYDDSFDSSIFVVKNTLYLLNIIEEQFYKGDAVFTMA